MLINIEDKSIKEKIEDELAIGIDLGTTNSVVAVFKNGNPEVVEDDDGKLFVPSILNVDDYTLRSTKRMMHEPLKKIYGEHTAFSTASAILKNLKNKAEKALNVKITKAVITVPAYFNDTARQATKDAAALAGIEVLRLINEPTAAALAYGLDNCSEGIFVIYDFGGGTFDVSILKLQKGVFQVLSTAGDIELGGDDIDTAISKHFNWNDILKARLAKENLTDGLTQNLLNELSTPYIKKTIQICERALKDANLNIDNIDGVVLVGGSTRLDIVKKHVQDFFQKKPLTELNPDFVVAYGAAIQAYQLTNTSSTLLLDIIPISLGIETMGGIIEKIIPRNTPIPVSMAQDFTTYENGQTAISFHVVQGEREFVKDCRSLAKFELSGIPPMLAGAARVRVTFTVDADGLLTVSAKEHTTNVKQNVEVKPTYGLTTEDFEKMLSQSYEFAEKDMNDRLLESAKIKSWQILMQVNNAIAVDADLLNKQEKDKILEIINELENALKTINKELITNICEKLMTETQFFAERRLTRAIKSKLNFKITN